VFKSMEAMAEVVVRCMREVQPVGPYTILGYSFGGNLAVEVATQLTADHQALESVIIFDAYGPGSLRSPTGLRKLATHLRIIRRLNFQESYAYIASRIQRRLFRQSQNPIDAAPARPLPKEEIERRIFEVSNDCLDAFHAHRPKVFSGRIVLLTATDLDDWMEVADPSGTYGWGSICKNGVDVIPIACRHLDVFKEPNVTVIAGHINNLFDRVRRGAGEVIEMRTPRTTFKNG
jgi:acetoacetyl-CoA synthetase